MNVTVLMLLVPLWKLNINNLGLWALATNQQRPVSRRCEKLCACWSVSRRIMALVIRVFRETQSALVSNVSSVTCARFLCSPEDLGLFSAACVLGAQDSFRI